MRAGENGLVVVSSVQRNEHRAEIFHTSHFTSALFNVLLISNEKNMSQTEKSSQERASQASSLPDTQNVDSQFLTQSQERISQQPTLTVWGRLYSIRSCFPNLNMSGDVYTLGRAETCDIHVTSQLMNKQWLNAVSKVHFRIYRECINNTNETVVYLEDLSSNGTYIDKVKVGCGNRVIIDNNSEISLSTSSCTVYRFENVLKPENNTLPLELKQKYALGRKLGSGACGEVRLIFTKDGTKQFALKAIQKCDFDITGARNQLNDPVKIKNEVEILRKLEHPCIIQMKDIHDTPRTVYIVLELMKGGELFEKIRSRGKLSESFTKLIFYQVILAVRYLHKQDITHRDLKPENILLADNSDITVAKVSDFGLAKLVDAQTMMRTFCGTPFYVAPEILSNLGRISYTNQVDVWSLGVILYVCLGGVLPFHTQNKMSLEVQIKNGLYVFPKTCFGHVSEEAIDLIKRMMTVDPKKRITVQQILQHSWLRDSKMRRTVNSLISLDDNENIPPSNIYRKRPEIYLPPEKRVRLTRNSIHLTGST
ncbi:ovarian-specific serine/threonine-protein kinase Lok-like [Odontomachus brunneus]|uniref:ovarian-specific serine/threonine-protein kinase Lok-like n=1 Tax=Odontomachus brunneus TaxID=486640 RepID=UPI0013F271E0|nr:ovarian-specific serine/threonine-protein kinase Lok-like [Odontomachus brunneus]